MVDNMVLIEVVFVVFGGMYYKDLLKLEMMFGCSYWSYDLVIFDIFYYLCFLIKIFGVVLYWEYIFV